MRERKAAQLKMVKQLITAKDISGLGTRPACHSAPGGIGAPGCPWNYHSGPFEDYYGAARGDVVRTGKRGTVLTTPRNLLLNLGDLRKASPDELEALRNDMKRRGWRRYFDHDRRTYRLLREGMRRFQAGAIPKVTGF